MMKKTIKIIGLSSLLLFISCNDFLDIEPDKRAQLDSKDKIAKLLVSAYPTSSFALLAELSSDNMDDLGDEVHWSNETHDMFYWKPVDVEFEDTPAYVWEKGYNSIANSNVALEAIANSEDKNSLQSQKGEALVTRAYSHFILVNIFGKHYNKQTSETDKGVIYMEKAETTLDPKSKRESVASNYKKIEKDLLEGMKLIADKEYGPATLGYHFSKRATYAFAARFYLYYEKWSEAEKYADKVLGGNPATVLKDWEGISDGTFETFEETPKQWSSSARVANILVQEVKSNKSEKLLWNGGKKDIRFRASKMLGQKETISADSFYGSGSQSNIWMKVIDLVAPSNCYNYSTITSGYVKDKKALNGYGQYYTSEVLFSTDETLLIRAEAKVMQNKLDAAAEDLQIWADNFMDVVDPVSVSTVDAFYNNIQYYADMVPTQKKKLAPKFALASGSQENMIHAVLQCRRVTTYHQGLRWFDVKRYGIEVARRVLKNDGTAIDKIAGKLIVDDPRRAIQLPKNVIAAGLQAN